MLLFLLLKEINKISKPSPGEKVQHKRNTSLLSIKTQLVAF